MLSTSPPAIVNPKAIEAMREKEYDLTQHGSKSLDEVPGQYEVAVTMGCGDSCPWVQATRREDWSIPDPKSLPPDEFRQVRDLIESKVIALFESL